MSHISNFVANFHYGIQCKRVRFLCFNTTYIKKILIKLIYNGFCRGKFFTDLIYKNYLDLKQSIELKYDFGYTCTVNAVKLLSCASMRVYARFVYLIRFYFNTENILTTTCGGVYFGFELVVNQLSFGGENILRLFYL